jgi:hypothetical protein
MPEISGNYNCRQAGVLIVAHHKFVVDYGLAHRTLDDITEIGVDEIAVFKGHKYLTQLSHRHKQCNNTISQ